MEFKNYKTRRRFRIYKRDQFSCIYCNKPFSNLKQLTLDHVYPKSLGGGNTQDNVTTCCVKCNRKKGNLLLTDFIRKFNLSITERIARYL